MQLIISSSPHQKSELTTSKIMYQVIYALIPVVLVSVYFFKLKALFVIVNCVVSCVLTEGVILRLRKMPSTLKDGSAALSGLLLALSLPPSISWYAATLGSIFAMFIAKHIFGGLGYNIFNPALAGRAFLAAAYPKMITTWVMPFSLSAVTGATPLALRKFDHRIFSSIADVMLGNIPGCLGETSALLLIAGGLYLLLRRIIDWRIPLSILSVISLISLAFYVINPLNGSPLFHLFSGGIMLGVFFMATDPVTTPVTKKGRFTYGIGCAVLIMVIRYFGGLAEGVMYSILFMNAIVPLINRYTRPLSFGR